MHAKTLSLSLVVVLCVACSETPVPSTAAADGGAAPPELKHLPLGGGSAPRTTDTGVDCSPVAAGGINPNQFPDTPCDDREPQFLGDDAKAPLGTYWIDCDPQPLAAVGCKGIPSDTWSRCAHKQCAARHSYPEGCNVLLPSQNPNYPGSGQGCVCMRQFGRSDPPNWTCGL